MIGIIVLGIIVIGTSYLIFLYNNIVKKRNEIDNAFGLIDAMLKKRYDLIPNLVETVKQYMIHEANVLSNVTELRSKLTENISTKDKVDLHDDIARQLNGIMLTVENYPDLKANQNFLKLQASWNEIEEQILASRRYYNTAVTDYNNSIQTFPSNIIANIFYFSPKEVLETENNNRKNVNAKELFKQ